MNERMRQRFLESTRGLQKTAAEMDAALTAAEKRRTFKQMVEEQRKKLLNQDRDLTTAKDMDEADGNFPPIIDVVNRYSGKQQTEDEILTRGTFEDRVRLYFTAADRQAYYEKDGENVTDEQLARYAAGVIAQKPEDRNLIRKYHKEFKTLVSFGRRVYYSFRSYQAYFGALAVLLTDLDSYYETCVRLNATVQQTDITPNDLKFVRKLIDRTDVKTNYDKEENRFYVSFPRTGDNLQRKINRQVKLVEREMSVYKAELMAVEEFIMDSPFRFCPIAVAITADNMMNEKYARYLIKQNYYYKSTINMKTAAGQEVTQWEKFNAVIPDWVDIVPDKSVYESCKDEIKQFTRWLNNVEH